MSLIRYRVVEIVERRDFVNSLLFHNRYRLGRRQLNLLTECLLKLKALKFNALC